MDGHVHRLECHRHVGTRQLVRTLAADMLGRHRGGHLADVAPERDERRLDSRGIDRAALIAPTGVPWAS